MNVRRARCDDATVSMATSSFSPVLALRIITFLVIPASLKIFLMESLYFCALMKGNKSPLGLHPLYFSTNSTALG